MRRSIKGEGDAKASDAVRRLLRQAIHSSRSSIAALEAYRDEPFATRSDVMVLDPNERLLQGDAQRRPGDWRSSAQVNMDWLLAALGLMLVIEGLMPLFSPASWRQMFARLLQLSDGQLRFVGLASLLFGLLLLGLREL